MCARRLLANTFLGIADDVVGRRSGMRGQLVGHLITAVSEGICFALLVPVLRVLFDGRPSDALGWLGVICCCAAVSGIASFLTGYRAYGVGIERLAGGAMRRVGAHAASLPLGWFTKKNVGALTALVTESTSVLMTIPGMITARIVSAIVTPLTVLVVVLFVDWRMALAMVAFVPLGLVAYRRLSRVAQAEHEQLGDDDEAVSSRVVEFAQAQAVLRSSGLMEKSWGRLDEALQADRRSVVRLLDAIDRPRVQFKAVVSAGLAAVVGAAVLLGTTGRAHPADLVAVLVLAVRFAEPVTELGGLGAEGLARAMTDLRRVQRFCATPTLAEPDVAAVPSSNCVAARAVSFGYGDTRVIRELSLDVPAGAMTAIVGPSGAGKTTLARLVARFWDPDGGAILLGERDLRDIGSRGVMERVAIVSQNVYLFDDTVRANVLLGRPDATEEEVFAAACAARLDDVVRRLPDGWDTRVGEGGSLLSGGERQRVSIARALLKDAPIVLLDEMTSALDAENERAIVGAIREIVRDRTSLVVAHRLSTIRDADQVVYLENGLITESGTPDELVAAGGRFAALWAARTAAEDWQITLRSKGTT